MLSIEDQDSLLDLMFVGTDAYRFTSGRGFAKAENMLEILACCQPCPERSFNKLGELLSRHVEDTSGLILVLLDWDDKRKALVRQLQTADIPVVVFIINETLDDAAIDRSPLHLHPERIVILTVDKIGETLETLDWNRL